MYIWIMKGCSHTRSDTAILESVGAPPASVPHHTVINNPTQTAKLWNVNIVFYFQSLHLYNVQNIKNIKNIKKLL